MRREEKRDSMGRERDTSRIQAHDGSIASCPQDGESQGSKGAIHPLPYLPEEIWQHIHSLVPMRDAARAACVSHAFLRSWRCHPHLTFTEETMCSEENLHNWTEDPDEKIYRKKYNETINHILENYSGAGVKTFKLVFLGPSNTKSYDRLNTWLQIAVTTGIEELELTLPSDMETFNFPCKQLSDRGRDSLRYLRLRSCVFRPTHSVCLRSLTMLYLFGVRITGDELGCILSNSFALEQLTLVYCNDIICLEIPCQLQRLNSLIVYECSSLHVMENKSPNLSTFRFGGTQVQFSLGESLTVKNMMLHNRCAISYAIDTLPSRVPNVETLEIHSGSEIVNAPVVSSKFLHLTLLSLHLSGWNFHRDYDYLSLVSFLDASPSLVTFHITVSRQSKYDMFEGDPSSLRRMPKHCHGNLNNVRITGFSPQKSMIELTCHILENSTSLKWLTLDVCPDNYRCFGNLNRKCLPLGTNFIREAHKSVLAVKTYVEDKVPSRVNLNVRQPCSRCFAL